jgi:signal transduction histidine kinase
MEEVDTAFAGTIRTTEWVALDMAIDIALQQAVVAFLNFQTTKLTASLGAEAKYLSFLAHDLRNGLNHIMLTMQWVEESIAPQAEWAEHAGALRDARISAEETIHSMERLLQAERLRKGVTPKHELVHLRRIAEGVIASFKNIAQAKEITLQNQVSPDATANTDPGLLTVILQNLVGNAVKYSLSGSIRLSAHLLPKTPGWAVEVIDQGPGIAPDALATIFDAFKRGQSHGQSGVGLGLYIASQGARVLGGTIDVESIVGKGSTFRLQLLDLPPHPEADIT